MRHEAQGTRHQAPGTRHQAPGTKHPSTKLRLWMRLSALTLNHACSHVAGPNAGGTNRRREEVSPRRWIVGGEWQKASEWSKSTLLAPDSIEMRGSKPIHEPICNTTPD